MIITDTHTHLYSESFDEDREEMIARAIKAGVERFFIPAIDSTYYAGMKELKKNYPEKVFLMSGLHPTHVNSKYEAELEVVRKELEEDIYVAVGEIGIDLYWTKDNLDIQTKAFSQQIEIALAHSLPIVIHCRDAFDEVFAVLEQYKSRGLQGIFHCFTGDYQQAQKALSYGMKLGIGGVVTFKNGKIDGFLSEIPIREIVLETDAPYLAPVPFRGKRNESLYICHVLQKVADLYEISIEEVAAITTNTSKEIFGV